MKELHLPNHCMLYHGSVVSNFIGILSQGLRIAPAEAPSTGYMFGKGVYFADTFQKSYGYSARGGSNKQQQNDLMLLCEVALGKSKELRQPDQNIDHVEEPYHSVKGCGKMGFTEENVLVLPNGVKIPQGSMQNKVTDNQYYQLQYNEFIVYNT